MAAIGQYALLEMIGIRTCFQHIDIMVGFDKQILASAHQFKDIGGDCTHIGAVFLCERLVINELSDALKYGYGIIQSSERIDAYIEAKGLKLFSDIVCKTASKHHDPV
jgi:hypothetical protein